MKRTVLFTAAAAIGCASAIAQDCKRSLLYTTLHDEVSSQCFLSGVPSALASVEKNSVEWIQPPGDPAAYMPIMGYNVLMGDHDADADYNEGAMFERIDALVAPMRPNGTPVPLNKRALFFSPQATTTPLVGAPFTGVEIGRIHPSGGIERLITELDVRAAFRIPAGVPLQLDAAALHHDPEKQALTLYLSFESTQTIDIFAGTFVVEDGAILRIPGLAVVASPADGAALVVPGSVVPGSGELVEREARVDAVVTNSGILNPPGMAVPTIGDTDGLVVDPAGGAAMSPWVGAYPNLWVSGENLDGGGIVTTRAGGQVARINGVFMDGGTGGAHVGLVTAPGVRSLNGLELPPCNISRFSMDSRTPVLTGPGWMRVEGGCGVMPPAGSYLMLVDLGAIAAGGIDTGIPAPPAVQGFRQIYPLVLLGAVAVNADNCGGFNFPVSGALHAALLGFNLEFQGVFASPGAFHLSNPIKVEFK